MSLMATRTGGPTSSPEKESVKTSHNDGWYNIVGKQQVNLSKDKKYTLLANDIMTICTGNNLFYFCFDNPNDSNPNSKIYKQSKDNLYVKESQIRDNFIVACGFFRSNNIKYDPRDMAIITAKYLGNNNELSFYFSSIATISTTNTML